MFIFASSCIQLVHHLQKHLHLFLNPQALNAVGVVVQAKVEVEILAQGFFSDAAFLVSLDHLLNPLVSAKDDQHLASKSLLQKVHIHFLPPFSYAYPSVISAVHFSQVLSDPH